MIARNRARHGSPQRFFATTRSTADIEVSAVNANVDVRQESDTTTQGYTG